MNIVQTTDKRNALKYFQTLQFINFIAPFKLTKVKNDGFTTYLQHMEIPRNISTNSIINAIALKNTETKSPNKEVRNAFVNEIIIIIKNRDIIRIEADSTTFKPAIKLSLISSVGKSYVSHFPKVVLNADMLYP